MHIFDNEIKVILKGLNKKLIKIQTIVQYL